MYSNPMKTMKNIISVIVVLVSFAMAATAQKVEGVKAENVHMTRNGKYMAVIMDMQMDELKVKHDRAILLTPSVSNGDSLLILRSVGVYSYNRWYYYKRNGETMIAGEDELSYRESKLPSKLSYEVVVPYKEWMDGAELNITLSEYGCCNKVLNKETAFLASYDGPYMPGFIYVKPEADLVKSRYMMGRAYIDFPVNETVIHPTYRNNVSELGKITSGIDSLRNDSDITFESMTIKGYASPESPYDNNARLAQMRTDALKNYVCDLYAFDKSRIETSFEPEDWDGLREFVAASDLAHKFEILEIIDSDRDPDNKEWKIKNTYKEEYRYLLDNCYPALRHTDYTIEYTVRTYNDPEEILSVLQKKPQNLSLNELYVYAQTLEAGSPEFIEVFETAVRLYPDDQTANLNAANTAMGRGDIQNALRYLDKSGDSPQATYARAVYAYMTHDNDLALQLFTDALNQGISEAAEPINEIRSAGRRS